MRREAGRHKAFARAGLPPLLAASFGPCPHNQTQPQKAQPRICPGGGCLLGPPPPRPFPAKILVPRPTDPKNAPPPRERNEVWPRPGKWLKRVRWTANAIATTNCYCCCWLAPTHSAPNGRELVAAGARPTALRSISFGPLRGAGWHLAPHPPLAHFPFGSESMRHRMAFRLAPSPPHSTAGWPSRALAKMPYLDWHGIDFPIGTHQKHGYKAKKFPFKKPMGAGRRGGNGKVEYYGSHGREGQVIPAQSQSHKSAQSLPPSLPIHPQYPAFPTPIQSRPSVSQRLHSQRGQSKSRLSAASHSTLRPHFQPSSPPFPFRPVANCL